MGLFAYKNVAYAKETTFGTSIAVGAVYLPVIDFNLNKDPEATVVEQTTNTAKGFRRAVNVKDTVEGDINFHLDFDTIGYWLNLGIGGGITSAALGLSATTYSFIQDTDGALVSGRFDVDKNARLEAFNGVFATELELSASDGLVTGTLRVTGKAQFEGATFTPSVTETRVATFANAKWYYGNSTNLSGATMEIPVTEWKFNYKNGGQAKFESGSNTITRQDTSMPTLELSFSRFYDGSSNSLVVRDNVYTEDSERAMKLILTSDSDSLIAGVTQYVLTFPMPKVKLKLSTRPYAAGQYIVEEASGEALADDTAGYMCEPQLISIVGMAY